MERFVSNYTKKVDGKGRVSVPPAFRSILQKMGDGQIFTQLSLETASVVAGGQALMDQIEVRLGDMDPFSQDYDDWAAHAYASTECLRIDGDGRIVLSDAICEHTGITGEVTFAGRGASFHLWEPSAFDAYIAEVRGRIRNKRAEVRGQ